MGKLRRPEIGDPRQLRGWRGDIDRKRAQNIVPPERLCAWGRKGAVPDFTQRSRRVSVRRAAAAMVPAHFTNAADDFTDACADFSEVIGAAAFAISSNANHFAAHALAKGRWQTVWRRTHLRACRTHERARRTPL
jgi:hypothetical protein